MTLSLGSASAAAGFVTSRQTTQARSAPLKSQPAQLVAQIFSPFSTHSSPSRRAVVLRPGAPFSRKLATPPGSLKTKAARGAPVPLRNGSRNSRVSGF